MTTKPQLDCAQYLHPQRRIAIHSVTDLCGGVHPATIDRWLKNPKLAFPKPITLGRIRYWREADILAWLDARAAEVQA